MDYSSMKSSFKEFVSDLTRHPVRTLLIVIFFFFLYIGFDTVHDITVSRFLKFLQGSEMAESRQTAVASVASILATTSTQLIPVVIKKDERAFEVDITYPQFNIPELDKGIKNFISDEVNKAKYEAYSGVKPSSKKGVTGSYDSAFISPEVISFRQYICSYVYIDVGVQSRCVDVEHGINFDRKNNKFINLEDALDKIGLSLEKLADKTRKKYPDTSKDPMFEDGFMPVKSNFSEFLVNDKAVTFLFQKYQLGSAFMGPQENTYERVR